MIELSDDTDIADMNNNEKTGVFIVSDDDDLMATRSEFFAALELKVIFLSFSIQIKNSP